MKDRHGISLDLQRRGLDPDNESTVSEDSTTDGSGNDGDSLHTNRRTGSAIDAFAVRIHQTLNPREVIAIAVHELRPILNCDRVCFLEYRKKRFRFVAASGHLGVPKRSRQAALLEQFVSSIVPQGERFLFPDDRITLPDDLGRRLADYWEQTNGQCLLVEPVFESLPRPDGHSGTAAPSRLAGALVIEQLNHSDLTPGTIQRLEAAVKHLTPAFQNARKYSRLVSIPGLYHLGQAFELFRRNSQAAFAGYFLIASLLIAAACLIKQPFEIECRGRLMPTQRREVFAPFEGEIIDITVTESDQIRGGDVLCVLQSHDLEKAVIEQTGLLKGKLKARDAARAELRSHAAQPARSQSARDQAQLELINAEIDTISRQLQLLEQEEKQREIRAPISGSLLTERPREKLLGRPVRRGESLLEIMEEVGGWQLELTVAERRLGHLLSYRRRHPQVNVKFRMLASAQKGFDCTITRIADRTVPSAELGSSCQVFCDVSEVDQLPHQVGAEVSARIRCGEKSLIYIWFHDFWELLQRNWWV